MDILRTPDSRFNNLVDYPFNPNYTFIKTEDQSELRIHHLDEGPKDGPTVLCMHGQPVWSYLYRKMIPLLVGQGLRVIAPDLPGYGKSDKPASRSDYSYQNQVDWMGQWLELNDFGDLCLFGQDWGGLIGLRVVADHSERFSRVVISNTGLPCYPDLDEEVVAAVQDYKANARTPSLPEMAKAMRSIPESLAPGFAYWQKFCWETEDLPVGFMMSMMLEGSSAGRMAKLFLNKLGLASLRSNTSLGIAYEAPFPDASYKMCPRAMPSQVPTLPDDPSLEAQAKAWEFYRGFEKPFLCAFSDDDPVTKGMDRQFIETVPGAEGQPHCTVSGGGHFIQEQKPEEISRIIVDFVNTD